jgi:exodeoxyribonuclease VII large subunit
MLRFEFEEEKEAEAVEPPAEDIYTVSRLNREVKELLEINYPLIWVEGEVSNLKRIGHTYLTLKDESSEIDCVMFAGRRISFELENGMKVLVLARLTIYEAKGRYQLVIEEMRPLGVGKLQLEFERLKKRLKEEGLFERKRPIPSFPERIGVVTSEDGAALRDICSVISRRYPLEIVLFPVRVQGDEAPHEIASAIEAANRYSELCEEIDTLIVGRGGGSLEDLWAFNEEIVAKAIFSSKIPVISAVGHEIDFTIADFVADLRAPTPSVAAEMAVPNKDKLKEKIKEIQERLTNLQKSKLESFFIKLEVLTKSYALRRPIRKVEEYKQSLDGLSDGLFKMFKLKIKAQKDRLDGAVHRLEAANPAAVLKRGYSVSTVRGEVIKSSNQVKEGDKIRVKLHKGELGCIVEEVLDDRGIFKTS